MSSNIQIVVEAEKLAKTIQSSQESQLTFASLLGSRMEAARLLSQLTTLIRAQWNEPSQPANRSEEKQPALFPSFNDWYKQKYSRTFDDSWRIGGTPVDTMLKALGVEMRQYLGELSAHMQGLRPEVLDKNLSPYNSSGNETAGWAESRTHRSDT